MDPAVRSLGYNPTDKEIEKIVNIINVDDDSTIDFSEFCMIVEFMNEQSGKYNKMRSAYTNSIAKYLSLLMNCFLVLIFLLSDLE